MTNLDQEIETARTRATLSDRNATGSYGAGHDRGYYEGLVRARQIFEMPGGVIQYEPARRRQEASS